LAERTHFIVKAKRIKAKGALEEPGIEVRSSMEVFQEEEGEEEEVDSY
jgi:hypothetical protein